MLVKSSWGQFCPGEIVTSETEKIMWVKFVNKQSNEMLFVAACYIPPPVDSSHDVARCQKECFQVLKKTRTAVSSGR